MKKKKEDIKDNDIIRIEDTNEIPLMEKEIKINHDSKEINKNNKNKATKKVIGGPEVISKGFIFGKDNLDLLNEANKMVSEIIKNNTKPFYIDYTKVRNEIRDKVGKYFYQETESKPMILIMIEEI